MLQPAVDITTSVHKFETILYQFKRDNLNEVDQNHFQKIMGLSVRQMEALAALNRLMTDRHEGIPLKTLAHHLRMSVPSTSLLVDGMVKKGLFDRRRIRGTGAPCASAFPRKENPNSTSSTTA